MELLVRFVEAVERMAACWAMQNDMYQQLMLKDRIVSADKVLEPEPTPVIEPETVIEPEPVIEPETAAPAQSQYTVQALRDALTEYCKSHSKAEALAILKRVGQGATKTSELLPALYPAVIRALAEGGEIK